MSSEYLFKDVGLSDRIRDLELVIQDKVAEFKGFNDSIQADETGAIKYHIIMDAHEIGRYSFPVNINRLSPYSVDELDEIFDAQIAYHDLFFIHKTPPVILKEYQEELHSTFRYFQGIGKAQEEIEGLHIRGFWENIVNTFGKKSGWRPAESKRKDMAMSIQLALHAFGARRFLEVNDKICYEGKAGICEKLKSLSYLNDYNPDGNFIAKIFDQVKNKVRNELTLEKDIISVDKTYYLNKQMIENDLKDRFVYFSSAPRTNFIVKAFERFSSEKQYPESNPWRTPIQIYMYLIHRVSDKSLIKTDETIEKLTEFKNELRSLLSARHTLDTSSAHLASNLSQKLEVKRSTYMNIFHKTEDSTLSDLNVFYGFSAQSEKSKQVEHKLERYFTDDVDRNDIRELIQLALLSPDAGEDEKRNIRELRMRISTGLDIFSILPESNLQNDDVISNCYETFPFLIKYTDRKYDKILTSLFKYWEDYYRLFQDGKLRDFDKDRIVGIVDNFEAVSHSEDVDVGERSADYYVTVALLHLISLKDDSNKAAVEYLDQLNQIESLRNSKDLLYIKANAMRRLRHFDSVQRICKENIEDYRFKHCSALASIAQILVREKTIQSHLDDNEVEVSKQAIQYLEEVIESVGSVIPDFVTHLKVAICADIIFLSGHIALVEIGNYETPQSTSPHLVLAKKYKDRLHRSKGSWGKQFSGYNFVEAFYEYVTMKEEIKKREFKEYSTDDSSKVDWKGRLVWATQDAASAKMYNRRVEREILFDSLQKELTSIRKSKIFG